MTGLALIAVSSAAKTAVDGLLALEIVAVGVEGSEDQVTLPFGWRTTDPHGLGPAVAEWMAAHPDFPIADYAAAAPTADDVWTEKDRRWALGFDYDFGDTRGVHLIGTTPKDLDDWEKVTALAQASINLGAPTTPIGIVTDTGPATVTATEWQSVIIAMAQFQQPIFAAAVALVAMSPIPADYAADSRWAVAS